MESSLWLGDEHYVDLEHWGGSLGAAHRTTAVGLGDPTSTWITGSSAQAEMGNAQAHTDDDKSVPKNRSRRENWTDDETNCLLMVKAESSLTGDITGKLDKPSWFKFVSEKLDRCPKSVQQRWDTLLKYYKCINDHDSKIPRDPTSALPRFFNMDANERNKCKLPRVFAASWFVTIQAITTAEAAKKKSTTEDPTNRPNQGDPTLAPSSSIPTIASDPRASYQGQVLTSIPPGLPLASYTLASTQGGSQQPKAELVPSEAMPDATFSQANVIAERAQFVTNQIDDALTPRTPWFPSREEHEQIEHRGKRMLVVLEEMLALKQEKRQRRRHINMVANPTEHAGGASLSVEDYSFPDKAFTEAFSFPQNETNFK